MEFAPSSPVSSPPRSSSPAPTNSSSATRVEPTSFDFFKKTNYSHSPHLMSSDIGSVSDTGSPLIPLSPVDEVPKPPEARESILYKVFPQVSFASWKAGPQNAFQAWKAWPSSHISFPSWTHQAPLELRFAARVSGRGCRPEFTAEEVNESKLASREAARQRLVLTAWEVEESERFTAFLNGLHRENQDRLLFSDEELKKVRNVFSDRSQEQIDDDTSYLQAVYDEDCEIFRAVSAQAEVLTKHLGSHIKEDILGSMGKSSHTPHFVGGRGSQRKGKAAIPKPPRGSGLNPSGLPAAGQLNLSAEQPQMSAFDFDPYAQSVGERQATQQQFHDAHGSSFYGDGGGPSSYGPAQGSSTYGDGGGPSSYGPAQGSSTYGDGGGPSSYGPAQGSSTYGDGGGPSSYGPAQGSSTYGDGGGPSSYGPAQGSSTYGDGGGPSSYGPAQGSSTYGDGGGPSSYGPAQGSSSYEDDDFYNHFRDARLDSGPSFADFPPDHHPRQVTPVPRWIEEAPDGGSNVAEQQGGPLPPASNLTMIQQGEIPVSEVVHTAGPARTTRARTARRVNMPVTPYLVSRAPAVSTEQHETPDDAQDEASSSRNIIRLAKDDINHAMGGAKVLITRLLFSRNAMVHSRQKKRRFVDKAIEDSIPQFYGPNVVFQSFITNAHRKQVANALSAKRGKIIDFARDGVCDAFQLLAPRGHSLPPTQYRIARVSRLIQGADPLLFMHDFYFDENDNIIVRAKFQNRFVMANVIRFVWYWGSTSFLDTSSLKAIKNVVGVAGAATHCALYEQAKVQLDIDPFGGKAHSDKFKEIVGAMDGLTGAEKIELEAHLQYVLEIGPSQARGDESSSTSDSGISD
ncbi:hypothetical protein C8R48DRAFT_671083 [Suillus tomentosus]|nr:hypothetical protein C8R48DRAFT_671083 [Suillus tomentosus]